LTTRQTGGQPEPLTNIALPKTMQIAANSFDLNDDDTVDQSDIDLQFASCFGRFVSGASPCRGADFDGSSRVDVADFVALSSRLGSTRPGAGGLTAKNLTSATSRDAQVLGPLLPLSTIGPAFTLLKSIEGVKWHDYNGNGLQDSGEPGIPNWTIYIDQN